MRFTDMYKEAVHRHNFPVLCRKKPERKKKAAPERDKPSD
jgi:hypothetical protein